MRLSTVIPAALAVAPFAAATAGQLGFALGARLLPKTPNAVSACKTQADYEADFDHLKPYTTMVRTYSAVDGAVPGQECQVLPAILPAAQKKGFKVIVGLWPDTADSFAKDRAALKLAVKDYKSAIYAVTVGSETLYRKTFKGPELLQRINAVKSDIGKGIKVGTADSWNKFQDGTANALITGGVDILLVNAFAFWQGQPITNSTATYLDDLMQAFGHIQNLAGSVDKIELWNGETGWPGTGGTSYGAAKAGTQNEASFFKHGVCAALDWGVNVFYFEAFDEAWKPDSKGDSGALADEKHWGAFDKDRKPKFSLRC